MAEVSFLPSANSRKRASASREDVTEVDKEKKCMKIHIVGYRNKFDECGDFKQ